MTQIALSCRCGDVKGVAENVSPSSGNRVVCCCSDCQAFALHLGRGEDTLDKFGGTEIYQMSQSEFHIQQGLDKLQSMRLSKNGLLRWHTRCCNTPVANTMNAQMPFVGVIHTMMEDINRDAVLGPVRAFVQTQYAIGEPDYPTHSAKFPLGITARIVSKLLMWRIKGMHKPSVFFAADGQPIVKPIVLEDSTT